MGSPSNWRMALEFQVFYFFKGILLKSVVLRILIGGWNKFGDALEHAFMVEDVSNCCDVRKYIYSVAGYRNIC